MIIFCKKRFILFVLLMLFFLEKNVFLINKPAYASICSICSKNKVNSKIESTHKIQQLTQIFDAHSQCLIQLQQQLSENQQDISIVRGNIQDIQHHILEIVRDQKEIYNKLNQILNDNKQLSHHNEKQFLESNHNNIECFINENIDNKKSNNNDVTDYKISVALVLEKKQYTKAIQAFQDFIKNHPQSCYQANAHYWLGQLYYNQGRKKDASYHFAWVVKNYPQSLKASDALLKIGMIMQETDQKDKAKTIYRQINKLYPNSDSAKQAQKRLMHL